MYLQEAVRSLLEIGKRDLSNPKYDSYFNSLQEELNKCTSQLLQPRCPKCQGINLEMHFTDDGCQICYCRNPKCKYNSAPAEFFSAPPASLRKRTQTQSISDKTLDAIVLDIAELPDRTSPDNWPEAMLVTAEELKTIIRENIEEGAVSPPVVEEVIFCNCKEELIVCLDASPDSTGQCKGYRHKSTNSHICKDGGVAQPV